MLFLFLFVMVPFTGVANTLGLSGVSIHRTIGVDASANTLTLAAAKRVGSVEFSSFHIGVGENLTCTVPTGYTASSFPVMMLRCTGSAGMIIDGTLTAQNINLALHTPILQFGSNGNIVADVNSVVGVFLQPHPTPLVDGLLFSYLTQYSQHTEMVSLEQSTAAADKLIWPNRGTDAAPVSGGTFRIFEDTLPSTLAEATEMGMALTVINPDGGGSFATILGVGLADTIAAGYVGATVTQFYFTVDADGNYRLISNDSDGSQGTIDLADVTDGTATELTLQDLADSEVVQGLGTEGFVNVSTTGTGASGHYVPVSEVQKVVNALGDDIVGNAMAHGGYYTGGRDAYLADVAAGTVDWTAVARSLEFGYVRNAVIAAGGDAQAFADANPGLMSLYEGGSTTFVDDYNNHSGGFAWDNLSTPIFRETVDHTLHVNYASVERVQSGILAEGTEFNVQLPDQALAEETLGEPVDLAATSAAFLANQTGPTRAATRSTLDNLQRAAGDTTTVAFADEFGDAFSGSSDLGGPSEFINPGAFAGPGDFAEASGAAADGTFNPTDAPGDGDFVPEDPGFEGAPVTNDATLSRAEAANDRAGAAADAADAPADDATRVELGPDELGDINIAPPGQEGVFVPATAVNDVIAVLGADVVGDAVADTYDGGREAFIRDFDNGTIDLATVGRSITNASITQAIANAGGAPAFAARYPNLTQSYPGGTDAFVEDYRGRTGSFDPSRADVPIFFSGNNPPAVTPTRG